MRSSTWGTRARAFGVVAGLALVVLGTGAVAVSAQAAPAVVVRSDSSLGPILTDAQGRTLYMYTKDDLGISNCYDQCAVNWPPLTTNADPVTPSSLQGMLGTTQRSDGAWQITYNGMPLYYWIRDQKAGDTTGQNVGGVWFVVNPTAAPSVAVRDNADLGTILTDARGLTLYMYTKDDPGTSNCYDQCAVNWPPLLTKSASPSGVDAVAAGLGTTQRNDGTMQVTYNGMPLYYWVRDQTPGDTTGQNVGSVWFVVNP